MNDGALGVVLVFKDVKNDGVCVVAGLDEEGLLLEGDGGSL